MAGNEKSDDGKWETGDGLREGISEEKLIATLEVTREVMLRLENVMCCVLRRLHGILNAVVLRLEIWVEGEDGVGSVAFGMLASSGAGFDALRQNGDA